MASRSVRFRAGVLAVLLWVLLLTAARDLLHTHDGLGAREDCPACRIERVTGCSTPAIAALIVVPEVVDCGLVVSGPQDRCPGADPCRAASPRAPPLPL